MKIKAIITGSTGMVGEGVLLVCLNSSKVEEVLVVNRKSCGISHPKLKEIIHKDFLNLAPIEDQLVGYNACYFCAGVSSVGKKEEEYKRITYDITLNFANTFLKQNPGSVFAYVSGSGTDSSEKGRLAWARIKGKTENDFLNWDLKMLICFVQDILNQLKGQKNAYKIYKFLLTHLSIVRKVGS
jgi:nucleoside-diphosphate-sugar epimerase